MKKIFLLISLASALIAFPIRTECQSLPVGVNPPPLAAGTGFTVLCGATDTSTYNYDILN